MQLASALARHHRGQETDGSGAGDQQLVAAATSARVSRCARYDPRLWRRRSPARAARPCHELRRYAHGELRFDAKAFAAEAVAVLDAVLRVQSVAAHVPLAGGAGVHRTGSGRRTTPTMRSPGASGPPAGACSTRPSDSWPRIRRSRPGGAQPYRPETISTSVPQIPIARVRTRTGPSPESNSGTSSSWAEPAVPGRTVSARIRLPDPCRAGTRGARIAENFARVDSWRRRAWPRPLSPAKRRVAH